MAKEFELQVTDNMGEGNGITHAEDNFMTYLYASDTLLCIIFLVPCIGKHISNICMIGCSSHYLPMVFSWLKDIFLNTWKLVLFLRINTWVQLHASLQ